MPSYTKCESACKRMTRARRRRCPECKKLACPRCFQPGDVTCWQCVKDMNRRIDENSKNVVYGKCAGCEERTSWDKARDDDGRRERQLCPRCDRQYHAPGRKMTDKEYRAKKAQTRRMYRRCLANTKSGRRCRAIARLPKRYCDQHVRVHGRWAPEGYCKETGMKLV